MVKVLLSSIAYLFYNSGGMYGLAGYDLANNHIGKRRLERTESLKRSKHWIQIGAEITEVCHKSYIATPTHLGPDVFLVNNQDTKDNEMIESGTKLTSFILTFIKNSRITLLQT